MGLLARSMDLRAGGKPMTRQLGHDDPRMTLAVHSVTAQGAGELCDLSRGNEKSLAGWPVKRLA